MLRYFFSFYILATMIYTASAQSTNHCATPAKILELKSISPDAVVRAQAAENKIKEWSNAHKNFRSQSVLVIPVVVHVIYENTAQNIPDSQIQLQLDILNRDYRKLNSDTAATPSAFIPYAADCEIEFCLAKRDEWGAVTTGIMRKQTLVNEIGSTNNYWRTHKGGDAIWDRDSYLNIWVCEIEQAGGILGYSTVPSFSPPDSSDGVVIDYRYFGTSTNSHYNKGRTATHEIGHWLDLQHIWGDDFGTCSTDDGVGDTPLQTLEHYGLPSYPSLDSCTNAFPGTMFMNYMDYTDDSGMNMFTQGQKQRIWAALSTSIRDSLFDSKGCVPVGIGEYTEAENIYIYPNPSEGRINLSFKLQEPAKFSVRLYNSLGNLLYQEELKSTKENHFSFDFSGLAKGLYLLEIQSDLKSINKKIILN